MATLYEDLFKSRFGELVDLHYADDHPDAGQFSGSGQLSCANLASALRYYTRFTVLLLRVRPKVAHIATACGLSFAKQGLAVLIARALGAQVVLAPHFSLGRLFVGGRLWQAYVWVVLRRCRGLIALSTEWLVLKENLPRCLMEYIPNSIDLEPYRHLPRPRPAAGEGPVRILFLGHIGKDKGSFDLVEAAAILRRLLPSISFAIEMRGESLLPGEMQSVQQFVRAGGLEGAVRIAPPVFGVDKVACLAQSDVFVLPSYHEGMPISLIEAMAAGLALIATNVGGIPDLVTDGENGLLVRPGRPAKLAEALARLICDPELRLSMGQQGRRRAQECHDLDRRVTELVSYHERVARAP